MKSKKTDPILDGLTEDESFFNRELSWLAFNERVLSLAEDDDKPLGERIRFLAISADNLNEFFMVRVAGLRQLVDRGFKRLPKDDVDIDQLLTQIMARSAKLMARQNQVLPELIGCLRDENIHVLSDIPDDEQDRLWLEDWLSERCKSLYGINQKDTWNPADIWLVSDLERVKRNLDAKILDNSTSLTEFNVILQDLFHKRQIVGVSLKKMSGKTARWELVNFDTEEVFDGDDYAFGFDEAKLNLKTNGKGYFENTESSFKISSSKITIAFQIRQNSRGYNNLKLEGTDVSARAARLGKAPLDMVSQTLRAYGIRETERWRSWRNYPKNIDEFLNDEETHIKRFKSLKATGKVDLSIKTAEEFTENFASVFDTAKNDNERAVANSKLQQLDLLNEIFSIRDVKKLSDLLSDIAYLGQKKGELFGPFAKLY